MDRRNLSLSWLMLSRLEFDSLPKSVALLHLLSKVRCRILHIVNDCFVDIRVTYDGKMAEMRRLGILPAVSQAVVQAVCRSPVIKTETMAADEVVRNSIRARVVDDVKKLV